MGSGAATPAKTNADARIEALAAKIDELVLKTNRADEVKAPGKTVAVTTPGHNLKCVARDSNPDRSAFSRRPAFASCVPAQKGV